MIGKDPRLLDKKFLKWAKDVKLRDNFTCRICNVSGSKLNSHHLNSWNIYNNERYDLDNGICLCKSCHEGFHEIYGKGHNTKEQFAEYLNMIDLIKKIVKNNK